MCELNCALNSLLAGLERGGADDPVHDVVLLTVGKSFEDIFAAERGSGSRDNVVRAVPRCRAALDRAGEDTAPTQPIKISTGGNVICEHFDVKRLWNTYVLNN